MQPPDHWHMRPPPRPRSDWWGVAVVLAAIAIATFVIVRYGPSGSDAPDAQARGCAGRHCPQGGSDPPASLAKLPPRLKSQAVAVVEVSCGDVVYGRNMDRHLYPASLTKIATALVAVDRAALDERVEVRVNGPLLAASTGSSIMGLTPGMRLSIRDLLYGLMLPSGNDAAIAIAEHVSGSVPAFVELMNQKALSLGLRDTHFENPHGLDGPRIWSSAYDMAQLGRAYLADPDLAAIARTPSYQPGWEGPQLWNGNAMLNTYPGSLGVKIGYTERAGETIVVAAERGERQLVVSVLGGWDRYGDATALLDWAFARTASAC
jgi:D-alanyl-D-alanine carboxypeptidase (penicillin-binding protein 5/6)